MLRIEKVSIQNANSVFAIAKETFAETFLQHNTLENLNLYFEQNLTIDTIKKQLLNKNSNFYLAKINENVVGYLKLNFAEAQTELQDIEAVEIERIYVLNSYHGQKIGQQLMDKAIHIAQQENKSYLWLGVWENNEKGIHFYIKNGFKIFDKHIFMIGNDAQTDFLMKLII